MNTSIGELAENGFLEFGDGYRTRRDQLSTPGYRILRVADVADGRICMNSIDFVSKEFERVIGSKLSKQDDVLLTTKGTVGRVAVIPSDMETVVYSPQLCYFRVLNQSLIVPRFLAYWFKSDAFVEQAFRRASNTDMAPYINLRDISSLAIDLPDLNVQRAIAEVLGALDDKIAANEKLAALTSEYLSAHFALCAEGKPASVLGSIADVNVHSVKPDPSTGAMLRYLDISSVGVGTYLFPEESLWSEAPSRARRVVRTGDTVWSTVRPNRRSHALVLDEVPLVGSTGLAVLTPNSGFVAGVYEATRTNSFLAYLETVAHGSAYPAVKAAKFLAAPVPDLGLDGWRTFEEFALPMRELECSALMENRKLAKTRDELLPLLMSGRLRVKDADSVVGEAV